MKLILAVIVMIPVVYLFVCMLMIIVRVYLESEK